MPADGIGESPRSGRKTDSVAETQGDSLCQECDGRSRWVGDSLRCLTPVIVDLIGDSNCLIGDSWRLCSFGLLTGGAKVASIWNPVRVLGQGDSIRSGENERVDASLGCPSKTGRIVWILEDDAVLDIITGAGCGTDAEPILCGDRGFEVATVGACGSVSEQPLMSAPRGAVRDPTDPGDIHPGFANVEPLVLPKVEPATFD